MTVLEAPVFWALKKICPTTARAAWPVRKSAAEQGIDRATAPAIKTK
jgi:hypothetical protein